MIVELVGPPGVGKTTLAQSLIHRNHQVQAEFFPYFRRIRWAPFFAINLLLLSPTLFRLHLAQGGHCLPSRDVALMAILKGWHRVLERQSSSNGTIVILEEGAICLLAKLHFFGSDLINSENALNWWKSMYRQWAETLDMVVRLEAPAPILVERVRSRNCVHEIDGLTDHEAVAWFRGIRAAQNLVISHLIAENRRIEVLHFDTISKTPDQICEQLIPFRLKVR